jgi:hypothetical protein
LNLNETLQGLVAAGTLVLAAVAVFQETIRAWFYRPVLKVSIRTEPPDCVAVPFTSQNGVLIADAVYLRLWIENTGNAPAKNAEVYATGLCRQRADGEWEAVKAFPPMNLRWANQVGRTPLDTIYCPNIVPDMGKHCDPGHIVEPSRRSLLNEDNPRLALTESQTSLAFDLMAAPNHKGHIVGPGDLSAEHYGRGRERSTDSSNGRDWIARCLVR